MSKRYFKEALLVSMVLTAIYALIAFGVMGILSFFMWVFNYGC